MLNTKLLCKKHLLGEHVELHMLIGSIIKNKSLKGFLENNLIEPISIYSRHKELVDEMLYRKYNHKSNLLYSIEIENNIEKYKNFKIDKEKSLIDLLSRCNECYKNFKKLNEK